MLTGALTARLLKLGRTVTGVLSSAGALSYTAHIVTVSEKFEQPPLREPMVHTARAPMALQGRLTRPWHSWFSRVVNPDVMGGGAGVNGPSQAIDETIAVFDGTTGKIIKENPGTISPTFQALTLSTLTEGRLVAVGTGGLLIDASLNPQFDSILVGTDDNAQGIIHVYGDGIGSSLGGDVRIYTAADYDTDVDYFSLVVYNDQLLIGPMPAISGAISIDADGNVGIGGVGVFDATMSGGLVMRTSTPPAFSVSNQFAMYSADQASGNAAPHFKTERGEVIKLYKCGTLADADGTLADVTAKFNTLKLYMKNLGFIG